MSSDQKVKLTDAVMNSADSLKPYGSCHVSTHCSSAAPVLDVTITDCWMEANDIRAFELRSSGWDALPGHDPGSHIDIRLPSIGVRQYSICNPSVETDRYVIAVKKEANGRGGSRFMHEVLQSGLNVRIGVPRNNFPLVEGPSHNLFVAGGVGITPILPMLDKCHRSGTAFDLHYFARQRSDVAFRAELVDARYGAKVNLRIDAEESCSFEQRFGFLREQAPETHVYVCGPTVMMNYVCGKLAEIRHPNAHIHFEYFAASPSPDANRAFELHLNRSGRVLNVPPDKSALDVLLDHGVDVPFSCEQGVCGTCRTTVLEGSPLHRDQCLTRQEQMNGNVFMPCCSRSITNVLVVDL